MELLCGLTRREDASLRLNGVWALMNMAFQADHKIKAQILTALGSEHVFRLLSDSDVDVLMKTLGLLRNLLSTKPVSENIVCIILFKFLFSHLINYYYHFFFLEFLL